MTPDKVTSIRELDSRLTDGIQVRLLWNAHNQQVWVAVLHTRNGQRFNVDVRSDERPLDVFNHPFAYAAHHGLDFDAPQLRMSALETRV